MLKDLGALLGRYLTLLGQTNLGAGLLLGIGLLCSNVWLLVISQIYVYRALAILSLPSLCRNNRMQKWLAR